MTKYRTTRSTDERVVDLMAPVAPPIAPPVPPVVYPDLPRILHRWEGDTHAEKRVDTPADCDVAFADGWTVEA